VVTAFAPGEAITITLDEPIFHPGHYRVALSVNDRSELPPPPPVTAGETPCGSVPIMDPAVFPVLADGMLQHTEPFSGTQSFQVTLPSDVTCTHCTLQVLEFMSDHAAPCFYHHCADISIGAGGGACETDAGCADDDACTRDACHPEEGCVARPVTLADVGSGFVSLPSPPACATEPVPAAVERLVAKADTLVNRAASDPAKAGRRLDRAAKRLRRAARKVAKAQERRISTECGTALIAALGQAEIQVACLRGGA
jgi:hypothetical protein